MTRGFYVKLLIYAKRTELKLYEDGVESTCSINSSVFANRIPIFIYLCNPYTSTKEFFIAEKDTEYLKLPNTHNLSIPTFFSLLHAVGTGI